MIRIFKLVMLLVISQVAFGQAPSNYVNINGRYRWIAGMFDSTFHIPKGSTPSLRTGGSTNSGGLFYRTSDSSVYTYTGTQWIKLRGSINPSDTTNKYVTQVYKKNASDSVFYVKGGNHLFAFIDSVGSPGGGGGGKVYYFNGGVSMGTFGGFAMYELGDTANTGAAANFTRSTTGNIANFITDPGKPGLLQIPAGVWSVDAWLSETGGGANHAEIWVEVEKWDGSTITTIATSPIEQITEGATPNLYSWSVTIPTTSLTITDRIIIQFYISNTNGKTVTLYTQNGYVGEVHTTFTTGIGAINGLTTPAQYLVTGTSGTDFNINSSTATHTFNLPTASATNRGALSTTDWTTFNSKIGPSDTASMLSPYFRLAGVGLKNTGQTVYADTLLLSTRAWRQKGIDSVAALINSNVSGTTNYVAKFTGSNTIGNSQIIDNGTAVGIGTAASNAYKLSVAGIYRGVGVGDAARIELYDTQSGGATFFVNPQQSLGVTSLGTYGAYPISFVTNNSERMRLDASGNLGLGTSSPYTASNYIFATTNGTNGSGYVTKVNGTNSMLVYSNSSASTISEQRALPIVFETTGATRMTLDASGNLGLGVSPSAWISTSKAFQLGNTAALFNPTSEAILSNNMFVNSADANIYLTTNFATQYRQVNGQHIWYNAPSGTAGTAISFTQAMTLNASGELLIGSTSDAGAYALQVTGAGYFSSSVTAGGIITGQVNGNTFGTASATGRAVIIQAGSANQAIQFKNALGGDGTLYATGDATSMNYAFNTYSTGDALVIKNNGSVGIGTTSPAAKLTVLGNISLGNRATAGTSYIGKLREDDGGISNAYGIGFVNSDINGAGYINFYTTPVGGSGDTRMTITGSGNVGIGTTSPAIYSGNTGSTNLTISGSSNPTTAYPSLTLRNSDGSTQAWLVIDQNSGAFLGTSTNHYLGFQTNNSERMRITSGGNVGIGTTSPGVSLEVRGSAPMVRFGATGGAYLEFTDNQIAAKTSGGAISDLYLNVSGSNTILNRDAGEVRIAGTTDQGAYNLQVNGTGVWGAGAYVNGSDSALKQNIQPLDNSLEIVKQMKPVTYTYKESYSKDTSVQTGFIAQDLQELLKDKNYLNGIVKDGTYLSVAYQNLIPLLVKAIQEQQAQIEQLKAELQLIKNK